MNKYTIHIVLVITSTEMHTVHLNARAFLARTGPCAKVSELLLDG